jgi:hypothetical protein
VINKVATEFYYELFGQSNVTHNSMIEFEMSKISQLERESITAPFTLKEPKKLMFSLKHNSAPSLD